MADFAHWVCAAEEALPWQTGMFLRYFDKNNAETAEALLQNHALAILVEELARDGWQGTATDLLGILRTHPAAPKNKFVPWMDEASALGSELRRLATPLRAVKGIIIDDTARKSKRRILHIFKLDVQEDEPQVA
jgi:hypothetical protein